MRCQRVIASKTMKFHSKENDMKKALLAVLANMVLVGSVFACQTQTIIVGGKMTTCTICGQVVSCI